MNVDTDALARLLVSVARELSRHAGGAPPAGHAHAGPGSPFSPEWLFLSADEGDVLRCLLAHGPCSKRQLASRLQRSAEGHLSDVLSNLVGRRVLVSGQEGYQVNAGASERAALREHLSGAEGQGPAEKTPSPLDAWGAASPTTLAILRVLCRESRLVPAEAIARELGLPLDRKVSPLLADLVERGVALARPGNCGGHTLAVPDGEDPVRFRARLLADLDASALDQSPGPRPTDGRDDMPGAAHAWRFLQPQTARVLRLLAREGWLSREEIATRLGEQPEGDIRPLLSDMVKRGLLESSGRKGYHVALPEDADPDECRRELLDWLEGHEGAAPVVEEEPAGQGSPLHWLHLSPLTLRVLRLLCSAGWLSKEQIALRLDEAPEGKLTVLLPDLAARRVLDSSTSKGYRLACPDDMSPDQSRREVLAWVTEQEKVAGPEPERKRPRPPGSKPAGPAIPLPATLPHDDVEDGEALTDEQLAERISAASAARAQRNGTH